MALLSCIIYKEYFYFIGYWLGEIIRYFMEMIFMGEENKFIVEEELMKLILLNVADLLTGFLVLYTHFKMKSLNIRQKPKKENRLKKLESSLIYNDLSRFKHKIFLIPLISILDLIASSEYFIAALFSSFTLEARKFDWMLSIDIIARIIFSIIILKIIVRKHHKLGILLCMIGFIFMSFSDIISIQNANKDIYDIFIFIIIIFPKSIIFPLVDVLYKIVLTNDFLLPHLLMFYRGLSQCIVLFIIVPILKYNNKIDDKFLEQFREYNRIIYTVCFTIISCIRNLCVLKVIYIFNSHYVSFLHVIIIFENTLRQFWDQKDIYNFNDIESIIYFIIDIIPLLLISAGTLIFNEMIIINACGLNEKTKMRLLIEEKDENEIIDESFYYEDENEENNNGKENQLNKKEEDNNYEDNDVNDVEKKNIFDWDKENEGSEKSF